MTLAADGEEAWRLYLEERHPLVVCDIRMPGLDGLGLLERIRECSAQTEVVLITGFSDTQVVISALRRGASNFVEKPFRPSDLLRQLEPSFIRCGLAEEASRLKEALEAEQRRCELEQRMATMGRLLAGLAHEVHNPLTFVKGNAELLRILVDRLFEREALAADPESESMAEELRTLLSDISFGARRVQALVENMKMFGARPDPTARGAFAVATIMERSCLLAQGKRRPNVELDLRLPPPEVVVEANALELETCLVNLIVNAHEAMDRTGGTITVAAETFPLTSRGAEGFVEIAVEDEGPGFGAGDVHELFTPFVSKKKGSQGLGLSIAYEAARRNGAHLSIVGREPRGTRAVVRMPYRCGPAPSVEADDRVRAPGGRG